MQRVHLLAYAMLKHPACACTICLRTCCAAEVAFTDQHRLRLGPLSPLRVEGQAHLTQQQSRRGSSSRTAGADTSALTSATTVQVTEQSARHGTCVLCMLLHQI
jgi:hypothetical protein